MSTAERGSELTVGTGIASSAAPRVEACIEAVMAKHPTIGGRADTRYFEAVHQELAPLARELEREVARLTAELRQGDELRERLGGLLSRTAVALRGPEPPLTRWSWHDLPERAAAAMAAIDVMQRAALMAADPDAELQEEPRHSAGVGTRIASAAREESSGGRPRL